VAGGVDGPEQIELTFAAGATRVVMPVLAVAESPERLAACLRLAGDWLAVGLDTRPERLAEVAWQGRRPASLVELMERLAGAGVGRFVLSHTGPEPDPTLLADLVGRSGAECLVAGGVRDVARLPAIRDAGISGVLLGEALLSGAIDFTAAVAAAA
jgi:phosphoribosylformimino-5-aminoimidazole carboxamide ribonucleotide (ProFAR) isomerase